MDINGSTPLTDMSETTQANNKYKKALKQINRLISINNSVKKELMTVQESYDALRKKYSQLEDKYYALEEEIRSNVASRTLIAVPKVPEIWEEEISSSTQLVVGDKTTVSLCQKKDKNSSPLSARAKQLENTGTLSQFMDTKRKLELVQQKLEQKDKQIQSITLQLSSKCKQNAQLYQKYLQASNNLKKLRNEADLKKQETLQKTIEILQNQISKQKQTNSKIQKEIQALKSQKASTSIEKTASNPKGVPISSGGDKNFILSSTKSRPAAVPYHQCFYSSVQQSLQNSGEKMQSDPLPDYYFKKVRDLEEEIVRVKKQYSDKRTSYKNQIASLKQQIQAKDEHIRRINNFTAKQQAFIESMYQKNQYQQKVLKQPPKMVSSLLEYTDNLQNRMGSGTLKNTLSKKALLTNSQEQQMPRLAEYRYY